MKKLYTPIPALLLTSMLLLSSACTRIGTGEVGLRINFDKTTDPAERLPGTFNQTIIGDILTFKI
ncbi:MAG: SPFH domain-containing protein, partial [Burkholderiales bacterium]|nr:SPFH domain-containing protein [Burkholderiales bacterium]